MYTLNFNNILKEDTPIAGGKGASLGEMTNVNIPVPPGFVILSSSFEQFLETTDLNVEIAAILNTVNHKEVHTVEAASEKIHALILHAEVPEDIKEDIQRSFVELDTQYVAVRSSATAEDSASAAWAGQLESYLNTTADTLVENIQKCWASLFTPRAIFYRFEKGLNTQKISVAVVVQKMVQSEISGIAFSVHPVTQDRNQLIIEAGYGLGEAIVSGQITPDSYVVAKDNLQILDRNVLDQSKQLRRIATGGNEWMAVEPASSKKQKLSDSQILELTKLIIKIESHYNFPCDIEWALEGGLFYIVQSRPITTLAPITDGNSNPLHIDGHDWFLVVTRNMSFWHECLLTLGWYHNTKDFGVDYKLEQLSVSVDSTKTHIFFHNPHYQLYIEAVARAFSNKDSIGALKEKYIRYGDELLAALDACTKVLTTESLNTFFAQYQRYTAGLQITGAFGKYGTDTLFKLLTEKGYNEQEVPEIIASITYPPQHTPLFDSQLNLIHIAVDIQKNHLTKENTDTRLTEWVQKFGNIPVNYCEEPWTIEDGRAQLVSLLTKDCTSELVLMEENHEKKIRDSQVWIKKINDEQVTILAYGLAWATFLNEYRKNIFSTTSLRYRSVFEKIALMAGSSNWRDCFYLTPDEMLAIVGGNNFELADLKLERSTVGVTINKDGALKILEQYKAEGLREYVETLHGSKPEAINSAQQELKGFSANRGIIQGTVRIVLSSKEFYKVTPGDILVTTMTSVDFVPVMEKAGAFVTNEGGITCHASIVAREMNKPCIIGTKIATQVLKDGDLVEVDANNGIVTIVQRVGK